MIVIGWYGADEKAAEIAAFVREVYEQKDMEFKTFESVSYTSQVVAGTNYTIKVRKRNTKEQPEVNREKLHLMALKVSKLKDIKKLEHHFE